MFLWFDGLVHLIWVRLVNILQSFDGMEGENIGR